jgi:hypothetical protein
VFKGPSLRPSFGARGWMSEYYWVGMEYYWLARLLKLFTASLYSVQRLVVLAIGGVGGLLGPLTNCFAFPRRL